MLKLHFAAVFFCAALTFTSVGNAESLSQEIGTCYLATRGGIIIDGACTIHANDRLIPMDAKFEANVNGYSFQVIRLSYNLALLGVIDRTDKTSSDLVFASSSNGCFAAEQWVACFWGKDETYRPKATFLTSPPVLPLPALTVDAACSHFGRGQQTVVNLCISSEQSYYNQLKYVWGSLDNSVKDKCYRRVYPRLLEFGYATREYFGYYMFAACVAAEQQALDVQKPRYFHP